MAYHGNFAPGGVQRSYSFPNLAGDVIPTSTSAVQCPSMPCEMVWVQNDPDSTGDILVGPARLAVTGGAGVRLAPGDTLGWIPIQNLNMLWHKDEASSNLRYIAVW